MKLLNQNPELPENYQYRNFSLANPSLSTWGKEKKKKTTRFQVSFEPLFFPLSLYIYREEEVGPSRSRRS